MNKCEEIVFKTNGVLTLGAEIELQLIDRDNLNLIPKANELLEAGKSIKNLKQEFYLSTVEICTDKHDDVHQIRRDLKSSFDKLVPLGEDLGISFATTGCHPFSRYSDCVITPSARYDELINRNQWLTRRMTVYGLHVHLGMKDGQDCIRFNNFFLPFLSHFLALSASSPFWQGEDTGLASVRPTTYESMPTSGHPYEVSSWNEFENLYYTLKRCNAINSMKDLWWDMRPSPGYGTLEIRVCDGLATLEGTVAIIAYIHLLAHWFNDNCNWFNQVQPCPGFLLRENKWRVMRYGLDAELVLNSDGKTASVCEEIEMWLDITKDYAKKLGYGNYVKSLREIMKRGTSSDRQRAVFNKTNSTEEVVRHNIREFENQLPIWDI
ncbi:MAG: putative glutamate-cysteine ligase [Rickettsiaceae bacterium]|jgi:carboxylate-amine ligase|nr:putative glutamate-cysteine ligase [Rickettsiaceae bacterium]